MSGKTARYVADGEVCHISLSCYVCAALRHDEAALGSLPALYRSAGAICAAQVMQRRSEGQAGAVAPVMLSSAHVGAAPFDAMTLRDVISARLLPPAFTLFSSAFFISRFSSFSRHTFARCRFVSAVHHRRHREILFVNTRCFHCHRHRHSMGLRLPLYTP